MLTIRRSNERGHADRGWLKSFHTFSFAEYRDLQHMGFRSLRVINEDWFAGGTGFPTHPHQDMEILTWVLEGALEHRDSLGSGGVIRPGDLQAMTAGTGIAHSEANASEDETVHLLQIWIVPEQRGLSPSYRQKFFPPEGRSDRLQLLASGDGRESSMRIHQDTDLFAADLAVGASIEHTLRPGRHAWVQVTGGSVEVNGTQLAAGDAVAASDETALKIESSSGGSLLLFDLA